MLGDGQEYYHYLLHFKRISPSVRNQQERVVVESQKVIRCIKNEWRRLQCVTFIFIVKGNERADRSASKVLMADGRAMEPADILNTIMDTG